MLWRQVPLFDDAPYAAAPGRRAWDDAEAGLSPGEVEQALGPQGRMQFDYARAPRMFGGREGWGPLLLAPDTNQLIRLVDTFDEIESAFGFDGRLLRGEWADPTAALSDLFVLWFWRDIRFLIPEGYLDDSRKPLSARRKSARQRVIEALGADLFARGGVTRNVEAWELDAPNLDLLAMWDADDAHRRGQADAVSARILALMPAHDGPLVVDALRAGAHVFLTEDRGVLRDRDRLVSLGIDAMRPGDLLEALEAAGELDAASTPGHGLLPDLLPLAHFYGLVDS